MTVTQLATALALIGTIGTGTVGGYMYLDGTYAKIDQVGANSQQIMLIKIENAWVSGKRDLLIRLCDDFRRTHGWTPKLCR